MAPPSSFATAARALPTFGVALLLASLIGCSAPRPPKAPAPVTFSFRPSPDGTSLGLSTAIAVEVTCEHAARALEAVDPLYVGELGTRASRVTAEDVALVAARHGATHFRVVTSAGYGDAARVDVVLYRVDRHRWKALPEKLRPLPAARDESDIHASL